MISYSIDKRSKTNKKEVNNDLKCPYCDLDLYGDGANGLECSNCSYTCHESSIR
jgi:tRNA(Ile2) C34 agmatinyltransferase TiaS